MVPEVCVVFCERGSRRLRLQDLGLASGWDGVVVNVGSLQVCHNVLMLERVREVRWGGTGRGEARRCTCADKGWAELWWWVIIFWGVSRERAQCGSVIWGRYRAILVNATRH